jgi:hypothetical protein
MNLLSLAKKYGFKTKDSIIRSIIDCYIDGNKSQVEEIYSQLQYEGKIELYLECFKISGMQEYLFMLEVNRKDK